MATNIILSSACSGVRHGRGAGLLDPTELLATARALARAVAPNDAALRRAVSTAYYALFHTVQRMATDRFVGHAERGSAAYAILYRGFGHGRMKRVCTDLNKPQLGDKLRETLGYAAVPGEIRNFAEDFASLQALRHVADYDPQATFDPSDAIDICDTAERAGQALLRADEASRTDLFLLLLVGIRA